MVKSKEDKTLLGGYIKAVIKEVDETFLGDQIKASIMMLLLQVIAYLRPLPLSVLPLPASAHTVPLHLQHVRGGKGRKPESASLGTLSSSDKGFNERERGSY